jgi:DNA-binding NtrC family response regulator
MSPGCPAAAAVATSRPIDVGELVILSRSLSPAAPSQLPSFGMDATVPQAATRLPVRSLAVEVTEGADAGARAAGDAITIGTADRADLRLTDPMVSRYHVELRRDDKGIVVADTGSTNGTWVGPVRLERGHVAPGTVLRVGATSVRVGDAAPVEVEMHAADALAGMVGRSAVMRRMMAQIARAAQSEVSVLITGESGTGKELVARALHDLGPRRDRPLVTVDCGSLPATLVASELFGHERGAFTGADRQHVGASEAANGGTVFLDEIGELEPAIQAALLGALERRKIRRLGGRQEIPVDIRIVAATHRDLRAEVNRGAFRLDLYYRLAVVTLHAPALRDRPEDIPLLIEHFLRDAGWDDPVEALISPQAMDALRKHHFKGNVRELRNLVEAAVAMGEPPALSVASPAITGGAGPTVTLALELPYKQSRAAVVDEFEARYVEALLARTGGNVSAAARSAQMTRSHLIELVQKHGKTKP